MSQESTMRGRPSPENVAKRTFSDPLCFAGRVQLCNTSPSLKRSLIGRVERAKQGSGRGVSVCRASTMRGRPSAENLLNARFPTLPASPSGCVESSPRCRWS